MQKKHFNNSIISFILIVSTILMPLSFIPKKAEAQFGGGVAGYASGLAPAIASLPQCQNVIGGGISTLFNGISHIFSSTPTDNETGQAISNLPGNQPVDISGSVQKMNDLANKTNALEHKEIFPNNNLPNIASSASSELDTIGIHLPKTTEDKLNTIQANTESTKVATQSINANSTCIQSIGRLIIKMLLQKLTVSTVNWINSGFDGSPAFIQDPGKYFNDIAKNEILQFGLEINNPQLFPFGKAWMQNTALAFNNKFANNAQYSLDKIIQDTNPKFTAATFQQDFSQGGWDAWTAMTQIPANNPLGFKLMADNEIQRRLAGTTQSTAQNVRDALQAANGFLGDQRCADPKGLTKQQDYDAKVAGKKYADGSIIGVCKEWEYVTPGSLVASAATTTMGYQNNAYLNVQDLNDAVAAVLDALLSQFSSNIMEKGFANIGDQGANGVLTFDSSGVDNPYQTQAEKDYQPSQLSSSWLSANPNFNIRTDLTQALIDEQRTYSDKLALQDKELMSTTDGKKYTLSADGKSSNAYGLMPVIYQLDYCIPGPHPGWEQDSRRTLESVMNLIVPETEASMKSRTERSITGAVSTFAPLAGAAIGASIGSVVPIVGTLIGAAVGAAVSFVVNILVGGDDAQKVRMYYSAQIQSLTGYLPNYENENDDRVGNISSKQGVTQVLETILNRYIEIMDKTYFSSPDILPTVTKEASVNFNQLAGYAQMIKNNEDKIASLKSTINTLGDIKNAINSLKDQYPDWTVTGSSDNITFENELKAQINAFGRVSSNMVNGDDIASADNLLKQIKDKKDYIYKNLLKGPYGCEKDLEKTPTKFPSAGNNVPSDSGLDWNVFDINSVKRMIYPFPILYDYNTIEKGAEIPDPWNSNYINKMPTVNGYDSFGPGFLSFVFFSSEIGGRNLRGSQRLTIHDLVPQGTDTDRVQWAYKPVGLVNISGMTPGPFETIIGVY